MVTSVKTIPDKVWLKHHRTLRRLWLDENRKLEGEGGVLEAMKSEGFNASVSQYEARFRKLRWRKKSQKKHWEQLAAIFRQRELEGKSSDVYIDGKMLSRETVRREIHRYSHKSTEALERKHEDLLVRERIAIRTPERELTPIITAGLPILEVEKLLSNVFSQDELLSPLLQINSTDAGNSMGESRIHYRREWWLQKLAPALTISPTRLLPPEARHLLERTYHMVYVFTNGFLASSDDPIRLTIYQDLDHIFAIRQKIFQIKIFDFILGLPRFSFQAVTDNLIRYAIERDNLNAIELIFERLLPSADKFGQHIIVDGSRVLCSEYAKQVIHPGIARFFEHAQPTGPTNESFNVCEACGNKNHTLQPLTISPIEFSTVCQDFIEMVFRQDDSVFFSSLEELKLAPLESIKFLYWFAGMEEPEYYQVRVKFRLLYEIASLPDVFYSDVELVLSNVLAYGVNLNEKYKHCQCHEASFRWHTLVDCAINLGNLKVIEAFFQNGAKVTSSKILECFIPRDDFTIGEFEKKFRILVNYDAISEELFRFSLSDLTDQQLFCVLTTSYSIFTTVGERYEYMIHDCLQSNVFLRAATVHNKPDIIQRLLRNQYPLCERHMHAALDDACYLGHTDCAKALLEGGVELTSYDSELCYCRSCDDHLYSSLSIRPVLIEQKNSSQEASSLVSSFKYSHNLYSQACYPLYTAMSVGRLELLKLLLAAGGRFDFSDYRVPASYECLDNEAVRFLISQADHINGRSRSQNALRLAVLRRDCELVKYLLRAGALINRWHDSHLPDNLLHVAFKNGDKEMMALLLREGANPHDEYIFYQSALTDPEAFMMVYDRYKHCSPRSRPDFGSKALFLAMGYCDSTHGSTEANINTDLIEFLFQKGANINYLLNLRHPNGEIKHWLTPLGYFIRHVATDLMTLESLLHHGGDANSIVYLDHWQENSALVEAIIIQDIEKVRLLLRYGAEANSTTRGRHQKTPLQAAAAGGSVDILELLLNYGADVNAKLASGHGPSALQFAASAGNLPAAIKLISAGAEVDASTSPFPATGKTALLDAAKLGRLDMVHLLLNAGAASGGNDRGQILRAIGLADRAGHIHVSEFLKEYVESLTGGEFSLLYGPIADKEHPTMEFDDAFNGEMADLDLIMNNLPPVSGNNTYF